MRRGILFTFDALLGSLLILAGVLVILHYHGGSVEVTQTTHYSQDTLRALNTIRVGEINNTWVKDLIADGTIEDSDLSVLEQIGMFWATGETALATNLTKIIFNQVLPTNIGYSFVMGDDELIRQNGTDDPRQRVQGRRMITGIKEGESLEGSTSTAYLKRIKDKESYVLTYFGGFVGQGNLTIQLGPLPADVTSATITQITAQLDTVGDFDLEINGDACMTLNSDNQLMQVQVWDVSGCNASIQQGMNNITLIALDALEDSYVAGGYVKIDYLTDEFQEEDSDTSTKRYTFPVIDGIINLYDSFYAPGIINDWYLNLTFLSNYTTYLRIGNQTIFSSPGSVSTQNVVLEAHNLSWAPTTIPLRLGTTNFTNVTFVSAGQPADTVLVTDVSGSMDDCAEWYTGQTCHYFCRWWWFIGYNMECPDSGTCGNEECGPCEPGYSDDSYSSYVDTICTRSRLEIAQEADKTAVDIILNASGNEVGLVSYSSQVQDVTLLTIDQAALNTQIDGYTANGGTCICCGINRAKDMLLPSLDKRFMIVMSDGDANYRCDNFFDYVGTSDSGNGPQSAIDAGQNACANNITVFTIGFGSGMSAQGRATMNATACNSSLYYDAINESDLEAIYRNISNQILLIANFTAQTLVIEGAFVPSHLITGSYLDLNYTSIVEPPGQSEILVKLETPQYDNCTTTIDVPTGLRLIEATTTSYSGPYWTSHLSVNGQPVFNLSDYSTDYVAVGDPFLVTIPVALLDQPSNTINLVVADNQQNVTNCSDNNTIFYTGVVNSSVPRSIVLEKKDGCDWHIEFEDDHFLDVTIPLSYAGTKQCNYTNASRWYDPDDAYDYGVYNLLRSLDFDDDGRVFVNIEAADLEIIVTVVTSVPYLWGPTFATLEVWR
ncbi:VWA domain-containing protein [Candidatus Woesearchaeota archaeon]|nr:VWA domain-containing protein [Candidatus Woesearchaeota archaeon]